jgi:hypothetical protein
MNTTVQPENNNSSNVEIEEVVALDENETDIEVVKAHAKAVEDRNKQLFARTKKAEGFTQDATGKWVKPAKPVVKTEVKPNDAISTNTSELSSMDVITIAKSNIHQDDIEEVINFAKFKNITVGDALKDDIMKSILSGKAELRKTAEGTNTGSAKRGNAKVSDESLVDNARNGKMPESDADMARLTILMRAKK